MTETLKFIKELISFLYVSRQDFYYLFMLITLLMLVGAGIINYQKPVKEKDILEEYMEEKRVYFGLDKPKKKSSLKKLISYFL